MNDSMNRPMASDTTCFLETARRLCAVIGVLITLCTAAPTYAATGAYVPDVNRGQILYERSCQTCHTPSIHSRPDRIPLTRDEMRGLVDHFRRTASLGWTPEELEDVVEYLNRTRYRFAPER